MNIKKIIIPLSLLLVLLMSTIALAATDTSNTFTRLGLGQFGAFNGRMNLNNADCPQLQTLPDEVKAQAEAIREKVQNGEITPTECRVEMEKILPEDWQFQRGPMGRGQGTELSAEVKAQVDELRAKVQSGEITREECQSQMQQQMQQLKQNGQFKQGRGMGMGMGMSMRGQNFNS